MGTSPISILQTLGVRLDYFAVDEVDRQVDSHHSKNVTIPVCECADNTTCTQQKLNGFWYKMSDFIQCKFTSLQKGTVVMKNLENK